MYTVYFEFLYEHNPSVLVCIDPLIFPVYLCLDHVSLMSITYFHAQYVFKGHCILQYNLNYVYFGKTRQTS